MADFDFTYDEAARTGIITINKSGEKMRLTNISAEQAERWRNEHAEKFVKRGFRMHTPSLDVTREEPSNG